MTHDVKDPGAFGGRALALLNLMRAAGVPVGTLAGGYRLPDSHARAATDAGLAALPQGSDELAPAPLAAPPRIALYCGPAIGYPYWGYYAHALLACGLTFRCIGPVDILAGALDAADLLVMPGGFATWGLDRAERRTGLDAAVRAFIAHGGAYIGSCGGAFYVAEGRPHWLGAFRTVPLYTQEYLLTGTGLVSISLTDTPLARGLPSAIEMPFFHGPIFEATPEPGQTAALFRSFVLPSRLFIENPLGPERFTEMAGRPAVLWRKDEEASIVAFSPHPEMGEYVRRGMLLDDYVQHFLPIRGRQTMEETLDFLGTDDAAGFRLIANAIDLLCPEGPAGPALEAPAPAEPFIPLSMHAIVDHGIAALRARADEAGGALQALAERQADALDTQWREIAPAAEALAETGPALAAPLGDILARAAREAALRPFENLRLAEIAVLTELPIRLCSVALRCLELDRIIREIPNE